MNEIQTCDLEIEMSHKEDKSAHTATYEDYNNQIEKIVKEKILTNLKWTNLNN